MMPWSVAAADEVMLDRSTRSASWSVIGGVQLLTVPDCDAL